jgi:methylmalonyl-CoA mutase N-terminal domain/subunit
MQEDITEAKSAWESRTLAPALQRFPEREARFATLSDTTVERLYTPDDVTTDDPTTDYLTNIGFPGEYPFTRGIQPTMYRGRLWTMRQYAGFATAEESNHRYRYLLEQGQTGLSVAFDLPTQLGYDSDHPLATGEVGKVGVAIASLEDMETLFQGIPLDKVSTSMTINATAAILLAMYIAVGQRQGVPLAKLSGTVQNDILKEYIARGTYIFPPQPSLRLVTDIFAYCGEHLPNWNTISISGYHIREAGSTAVQEVAFTLANAIAYVQAAMERGLQVDDFAPRLSFFFNATTDVLEEVAKFRAARRLWAHIMRERFGAKDPRSWMLRFHTQTAGSLLTAQQPDNNVVRVTLQALAAVLGGTQSLHTNSRDEALSLPTEDSVRLALRTQQVIAHESGVANTIDPLAGSCFVEHLTNEIERQAGEYIARIDRLGGALAAIQAGYPQREIQESAYRYQREVESGRRIVVGVNQYVLPAEGHPAILRVDPAVGERQAARLAAMRARRNGEEVTRLLATLRAAAQGRDNPSGSSPSGRSLMPLIIAAVEGYCTLGEICEVLREVFGVHRETVFV